MPSGGFRPSAPQNNFGVSASGGNGNKGNSPAIRAMTTQAPRYMPGLPQGQGRATFNNSKAAPLAGNPTPQMAAPQVGQNSPQMAPTGTSVTPLTAPTQRPNEPVTAGAALGPGVGPEAIGITPGMTMNQGQSAKQTVQALASHPDASSELQSLASALGK